MRLLPLIFVALFSGVVTSAGELKSIGGNSDYVLSVLWEYIPTGSTIESDVMHRSGILYGGYTFSPAKRDFAPIVAHLAAGIRTRISSDGWKLEPDETDVRIPSRLEFRAYKNDQYLEIVVWVFPVQGRRLASPTPPALTKILTRPRSRRANSRGSIQDVRMQSMPYNNKYLIEVSEGHPGRREYAVVAKCDDLLKLGKELVAQGETGRVRMTHYATIANGTDYDVTLTFRATSEEELTALRTRVPYFKSFEFVRSIVILALLGFAAIGVRSLFR